RRPQRTLRGVAPHGPVPVLLLEGLREAAAAREVPLDRRALLPPGRIHREAAEAGAGIRANRFGDRATLRRASPRPIKTYIPLQQGTQSLLHARQANVIPA